MFHCHWIWWHGIIEISVQYFKHYVLPSLYQCVSFCKSFLSRFWTMCYILIPLNMISACVPHTVFLFNVNKWIWTILIYSRRCDSEIYSKKLCIRSFQIKALKVTVWCSSFKNVLIFRGISVGTNVLFPKIAEGLFPRSLRKSIDFKRACASLKWWVCIKVSNFSGFACSLSSVVFQFSHV